MNNSEFVFWIVSGVVALGIGVLIWFYFRVKAVLLDKQQKSLEIEANLRHLHGQREELARERQRIRHERDHLHQTVRKLFPSKVAQAILGNKGIAPQKMDSASVMVAQIPGIYPLAESMDPREFLRILDHYYTQFDAINERLGVYRLKTSGEKYVSISGMEMQKTHAVDTVLAALKYQSYARGSHWIGNSKSPIQFAVSVSVYTGPCVSGMVGNKNYAFDVWGEAVHKVNWIHNQLQQPGIFIGEPTRQLIAPFFRFKPRLLPGGERVFEVLEIRPGLSRDSKGTEPNAMFWEHVCFYLDFGICFRDFEQEALNYLTKNLPDNLYYHSVQHAITVDKAVEKIALAENIRGEALFCLKAAALLHDSGFVKSYEDNEAYGVEIAAEILPKHGFNEQQIALVSRLILATDVRKKPTSKLEQIIQDADLLYLGQDKFETISDALKDELMERRYIVSDGEWDELQMKFLSAHNYHTSSAQHIAENNKIRRLSEIKTRVSEQQ